MHEAVRPAQAADIVALSGLLAAATAGAVAMRGGGMLLSGGGAGPAVAPGGAGDAAGGAGAGGGAADAVRAGDDGPGHLRRWLESPAHLLLSGCIDDVVVGLAAGHLGPAGPGGAPVGVVDCCYVDTEARQVGIGAALASALVEWFNSRGCEGVDALALPGDRSTKQLWEAAGFSARLLVLHRRLG